MEIPYRATTNPKITPVSKCDGKFLQNYLLSARISPIYPNQLARFIHRSMVRLKKDQIM
jgi:hypothetical protein